MPAFLAGAVSATVEYGADHDWHFILIYYVLGPLAIASVLSSAVSVCLHLACKGDDKRHALTIRVLLMVPIYSIVAWITIVFRFTTFAKVVVAFQKFYECIVLFSFTHLLVEYLGGARGCFRKLTDMDSDVPCPGGDERCNLLPPLTWLLPCVKVDVLRPPKRFLRISLGSILTYVPVLLVCFLCTFVSYFVAGGKYLHSVDRVCSAVIFLYTSVSMYGLVLFYHANMKSLENVRPVMKLLSIKLLVFFTGMQEFGMKAAVHYGILDSWAKQYRSYYTTEELAESILAGILLVEMLLLSFLHFCIYPAKDPIYSHRECEAHADAIGQQRGPTCRRICRRICLICNVLDLKEFCCDLKQLWRVEQELPKQSQEQPRRPAGKFTLEFSNGQAVSVSCRPLGIRFHDDTLRVQEVQQGSIFAGLAGSDLKTVQFPTGQSNQASREILEELPIELAVHSLAQDFCTVSVKLTDTIKDIRSTIHAKNTFMWSFFDVYISYGAQRKPVKDSQVLRTVIDSAHDIDMDPPSISLQPVKLQCKGRTQTGTRCKRPCNGFELCWQHQDQGVDSRTTPLAAAAAAVQMQKR